MDIITHIKQRRSVRTYDGKPLEESIKAQLLAFSKTIQNPYGIPVTFRLLDAKQYGLTCPIVTGTELYVGGKIKNGPNASVAFGYSFEAFVLYAQSLGVGTVWLGGTMNRDAFEQAMELEGTEIMPCASPLGMPAARMSLRESMMRKAIKADARMSFEELFRSGTGDTPLTREAAGHWATPLEMVRLAPSAVNKQPWRAIVTDRAVHFYLMRSSGFKFNETLDMQQVDMGIALCHFDLAARACGLDGKFSHQDPQLCTDPAYILSYQIAE